jgi:hypothetical protein
MASAVKKPLKADPGLRETNALKTGSLFGLLGRGMADTQCPAFRMPNKTTAVILSERGPERFSVRGW